MSMVVFFRRLTCVFCAQVVDAATYSVLAEERDVAMARFTVARNIAIIAYGSVSLRLSVPPPTRT